MTRVFQKWQLGNRHSARAIAQRLVRKRDGISRPLLPKLTHGRRPANSDLGLLRGLARCFSVEIVVQSQKYLWLSRAHDRMRHVMQSQILLLCQPCENISPARERRGQEGGWHTKQQHDILQLGALAIKEFVKPHQRIDGVRVACCSGVGARCCSSWLRASDEFQSLQSSGARLS